MIRTTGRLRRAAPAPTHRRLLLLLALLMPLFATGCMQSRMKHQRDFGATGQGPNDFREPTDIACDSKGNIYVCDTGNGRILRFDENGDGGSVFAGGLKRPMGICVDKSDYVYVAETGAHRVHKFGPNGGRPLKTISGTMRLGQPLDRENALVSPRDVAADESANIYIVDYRQRLLIYDSSCALLHEFKGDGASSQFKFPTSITLSPYTDQNKSFVMYIADAGNARVTKFSHERRVIFTLKEKGILDHLRDPRGIALNPTTGEFFVADCGATPVAGYSSSGAFTQVGGAFGKGPGKLLRPGGIAVFGKKVYVTDTLQDKVSIFLAK